MHQGYNNVIQTDVFTTKKPKKATKPTYIQLTKPVTTYANPFPSHDGQCPWRKKNSQDGDCGKKYKNRCSLKYFRICGEDFFNYIYDDVCRWQDALQVVTLFIKNRILKYVFKLIPMFTSWLVPLGKDFEMAIGATCSGYGSRTFEELIGKIDSKEKFENSSILIPALGYPKVSNP